MPSRAKPDRVINEAAASSSKVMASAGDGVALLAWLRCSMRLRARQLSADKRSRSWLAVLYSCCCCRARPARSVDTTACNKVLSMRSSLQRIGAGGCF